MFKEIDPVIAKKIKITKEERESLSSKALEAREKEVSDYF
jgi:hypothetical protein